MPASGPRVAALAAPADAGEASGSEPLAFENWDPSDPPPLADRALPELLDRFERERAKTITRLGADPDVALGRRARLGGESINGYQFLRGIAQHDDAHALRIRERVHPALYEAG